MDAAARHAASAAPSGRLADNIVYFARTLRKAGMRVGPASVKDAIEAVLAAGIGSRDDFYWTLHAVLVSRHEDHAVFDEAFRLFWKSRELIEKLLAMFSPVALDQRERQKPRAAENRVSQAMFDLLFTRVGVPSSQAVALSILFVALAIVGNLPGAFLYATGKGSKQ